MPEDHRQIVAVHYIYLLKDEESGLQRLWSLLVSGKAGESSSGDLSQLEPDALLSDRCSIMRTVKGEELDLCLAMLPKLAVVEMVYHLPSGKPQEEAWLNALSKIEESRARMTSEGVPVFGETTMLVSYGEPEENVVNSAVSIIQEKQRGSGGSGLFTNGGLAGEAGSFQGKVLTTELDPDICGGKNPSLIKVMSRSGAEVEHFILMAETPGGIISTLFPDLDAIIKELTRSTSYFREQRNAIIKERANIDNQVGTLLHRQVVSTKEPAAAPGELEKHIESLSRMFGLLATDSLMTRKADNRMERDIEFLNQNLILMRSPETEAIDEIGNYYLDLFGSELKSVRSVARDLDYSRQNAEAGIEVVRVQVELLRANEETKIQQQTRELIKQSLVLQEEGLALQVAAGLIEFVLVFYYVFKSWEGVLGIEEVEHLAPLVRMLPVFGIALGASLGTHFLARSIKNGTWRNPGLWISAVILVLSLLTLVILSLTVT